MPDLKPQTNNIPFRESYKLCEACDLLGGISYKTLKKITESGVLRVKMVGGSPQITRNELKRYLLEPDIPVKKTPEQRKRGRYGN